MNKKKVLQNFMLAFLITYWVCKKRKYCSSKTRYNEKITSCFTPLAFIYFFSLRFRIKQTLKFPMSKDDPVHLEYPSYSFIHNKPHLHHLHTINVDPTAFLILHRISSHRVSSILQRAANFLYHLILFDYNSLSRIFVIIFTRTRSSLR